MTDESITFGLVTRPNLAHARTLLDEIAATAIFCAFALRNAAVASRRWTPNGGETCTPPWKISLARSNLTYKGTGTSKGAQYDRLAERTRDVVELGDELRSNPRAWHNLSTDETVDGDR